MRTQTPWLYLYLLLIALLSFSAQGFSQYDTDSAIENTKKSQGAVIFSTKYKNLNLKKAYHLQKAYVKNSVSKGEKIIGYKAGLMREHSAQQLGLSEPISGVLINEPLSGNDQVVTLGSTHRLMLEQEFAFRFTRKTHKGMTLDELKKSIDAVAPAIELPDISFTKTGYNGLDIIANNALAYKFILGEWQELPANIDDVAVTLSCNGEIVANGSSKSVMGSQWQALLWMVNHLSGHGYNIQKDQIVITGSMIKMREAKPCDYTANFGKLGEVTFKIKA